MQEYIDFVTSGTMTMMLSVAWIALVIAFISNIIKSKTAKYKEISVDEMTRLINREEAVVIDLRAKEKFKKGTVTDALNVQPEQVKSGNIAQLDKFKVKPVILICDNGMASLGVAADFVNQGFEHVSVLNGGLITWQEKSLPLVHSNN